MFVELHILQNFAPANLNRDDTGSPKDCEFGLYRRARISSQCLKRATRKAAGFEEFLEGKGGVRTRRLVVEIAKRLCPDSDQPPPAVVKVVSAVFEEGGLERPKDRKGNEEDHTKLLLFMDAPAIDSMVGLFKQHWQALETWQTRTSQEKKKGPKHKANDARLGEPEEQKAARDRTADETVKELGEILAGAVRAPDIALFGRMVEIGGDKPFGKLQLGVDGACQVAHAISTNRVTMEFDFFTAVDDLQPKGETGAGMMGTVGFNSACLYRYANVDMEQLKENLGGDEELARKTLEAFVRASIDAMPTGKQNSMAAQNPPSLVLAVVRRAGLWSLANAFVQPVRPTAEGDLVQNSIAKMDEHWGNLARMYGEDGIAGKWVCSLDGSGLKVLDNAQVERLDQLVSATVAAVTFRPNGRSRIT